MKRFKDKLSKLILIISLFGLQAAAYANSSDNTFGDVADQFQNWAQGSYGRLVLMVALGMILGSFIFGGGAKLLWGGVGLALVVKYGAQILNTISGVSAEIVQSNSWQTPDSLGWNALFEIVLIIGIAFLSYKNKKLRYELEALKQSVKTVAHS